MKRVELLYNNDVISEQVYADCRKIFNYLKLHENLIFDETQLFTHLAMALKRQKEKMVMEAIDEKILGEIKKSIYYEESLRIANQINEHLNHQLIKSEIDYLTLHLCTMLKNQEGLCKTKLIDGYTLIHEHTTIDLSSEKKDEDCRVDCFEETVKEYKKLYDYGVRNIVDVTALGMGRNPSYVKEVELLSGIRILSSTGYYKEPFLPNEVYDLSIQELADKMIKELEVGMDNTSICAELIGEIGTSLNQMKEMEKKIFDAAILAHQATQCVVSTHTTLGTCGIEQARYLIDNGVTPAKIIIGHQDLSGNLDQIKTLLSLGVNVGFDTVGKMNYLPDEERVKFICDLQEENLLDKVVLSMDITRKSNLSFKGGIGYTYLFESFIPLLKKMGVHETSIDLMLKENAKRIFS